LGKATFSLRLPSVFAAGETVSLESHTRFPPKEETQASAKSSALF